MAVQQQQDELQAKGPKFHLNIEGQVYDWNEDTITVPQIRTLGSLPPDLPVVQIDLETNTQIQLAEDAIVELKPGLGFSKKVKWQRGLTRDGRAD